MLPHQGVPVPLEIVGIGALPPVELKVVTSGTQVGIQGATYLASKFFDLKKLGSDNGKETFSWEAADFVYVCNVGSWSPEHVAGLLRDATAARMPNIVVQITTA